MLTAHSLSQIVNVCKTLRTKDSEYLVDLAISRTLERWRQQC
jgi:hypothetical protein